MKEYPMMQKLFKTALGIQAPWHVKSVDFNVAAKRLILKLILNVVHDLEMTLKAKVLKHIRSTIPSQKSVDI